MRIGAPRIVRHVPTFAVVAVAGACGGDDGERPAAPPPAPPVLAAVPPIPAGRHISGRVLGPDGRPVADAAVEAFRREFPDRVVVIAGARTDREGRFALAPIPAETLRCFVRASATGLLGEPLAAEVGDTLPLRLRAAGRVRGTLKSAADGRPLSGARVVARRGIEPHLRTYSESAGRIIDIVRAGADPLARETIADAAGGFALAPVDADVIEVAAEAPGHAPRWESVRVPAGGEASLDLALAPLPRGGAAIAGRVTCEGAPVPGARVATTDGFRWAVTDAEGRYRIEGVAALTTLLVTAPGHAATYAPEPGYTETRADGSDFVQDAELARAGPVAGDVFDAEGNPVAGARVGWSLAALVQGAEEGVTRTDAEGRFALGGPPPGEGGSVMAVTPDGGYGKADVTRDEAGACPRLLVRLRAPCVVRGRVLDERDRGVAGVQVISAWSLGMFLPDLAGVAPATWTAADGTFTLRLPPSSEYGLHVVAPGTWPALAWSMPFEAPAGGEIALDILTGPGEPISGVVVDPAGRPAAEVEVRARPESWRGGRPLWVAATTDAAGRFTVEGILREPHSLQAVHEEDSHAFRQTFLEFGADPVAGFRPGARDVRIVRPAAGSLAGRIVDERGSPVPRIALYAGRSDGSDSHPIHGTLPAVVEVPWTREGPRLVPRHEALDRTPYSARNRDDRLDVEEDGTVRYERFRWGRWTFLVDDPGFRPASVEVVVEQGREARFELAVERRGRLAVIVRDSSGAPVERASVAVFDPRGVPVPALVEAVVLGSFGGLHRGATVRELFDEATLTNSRGTTGTRWLDAGTYTVIVLREGFAPGEAEVVVRAGEETPLDVVL